MTNIPPTVDEVMQNNDPLWLREQADLVEAQAHALAEIIRGRADEIELRKRLVEVMVEKTRLEKVQGSNEIKMRRLNEQ
jgi:hypothetical protein